MVSGVWLQCPSSILAEFSRQEVRNVITHGIPILESLPPYGIGHKVLIDIVQDYTKSGIQDGVMVDW